MQSSRFNAETVIGGKWVLDRPLGRGGMGEVWVAKHTSLDEEVALKLLDRRTLPAEVIDEARSRFHLEAQLAARLAKKSRHIAAVVDHGHEGDFDYLVLELLRGTPLDEHLSKVACLPPGEVAAIVRQVARALVVAHREGVVHRDLKPGNVFITHDDEGRMLVKLIDFGIAKSASRAPKPVTLATPDGAEEAPKSSHRTRVGIVLGTPEYMSPEQARGLEVDGKADVWALACITFELLTGVVPFAGDTETDVMINVCMGKRARARALQPELPFAIDDLFTHAFSVEMVDRFADPASFSAALDHALNERSSMVEISVGGGVPSGPMSLPMSGPISVSVPGVVLERRQPDVVPSVASEPAAAPVPASEPAGEPAKAAAKKSRAPAAWAAGAVLLALLAAFFVFRASAAPPGRTASDTPSAAPTPTPNPTPATTPNPTATPTNAVPEPNAPLASSVPSATDTHKSKTPTHAPTAGKTKPVAPTAPTGGKKVDPSEIL